jgi:thioredoxin-dependent peroxiredoxin
MTAVNGAGNTKLGAESVGQTINVEGFGGRVSRHDGVETSLGELLEGSGSGVVVFTYPKASTPGCKLFYFLSFLIGE